MKLSRSTARCMVLLMILSACTLASADSGSDAGNDSGSGKPSGKPDTTTRPPAAYTEHCASCHGEARLGGIGPALLPEGLRRLSRADAAEVIQVGRPLTQMPGFGPKLSPTDLSTLVDWIYSEPSVQPSWGPAEIRASYVRHLAFEELPKEPTFQGDRLNLFMVVEQADHHVSVLDGDELVVIHRFPSRFALHGGIKYSPDGRFAFLASRDGWISQFDLYSLKIVAEIRAGINTRNIAISGDGRILLVANTLPHSVVALDASTLALLKVIPARSKQGKSSRVSAVYAAPSRESFIVALKDVAELWELDYRQDARAEYTGLVHDFGTESGEKIVRPPELLPIRRIALEGVLDDFFFDSEYHNLLGSSRNGSTWVVNLDVGRPVKKLDLGGLPHLGSGITWKLGDREVMASPNLQESSIAVLDTQSWEVIRQIPTLGPGFFLRSHENSPYAFADVFFGPHRDVIHVIDKQSLEIKATLRPAPGSLSGHVEFTRDGKRALVSISEPDGEIVVYDSMSLEIVKRIPMRKPSGKYNVFNKISYSNGTSH